MNSARVLLRTHFKMYSSILILRETKDSLAPWQVFQGKRWWGDELKTLHSLYSGNLGRVFQWKDSSFLGPWDSHVRVNLVGGGSGRTTWGRKAGGAQGNTRTLVFLSFFLMQNSPSHDHTVPTLCPVYEQLPTVLSLCKWPRTIVTQVQYLNQWSIEKIWG